MDKKEASMQRLHAGETLTDIVKAVELSVATVFYPKCYLWECGAVQTKSGSRKESIVMTNWLLGVKSKRIHCHLVHTMRGMARETRVSHLSICKAVNLNLARFLFWNSKFCLMDSLVAARLEKCQWFLWILTKNCLKSSVQIGSTSSLTRCLPAK